MLASHEGWFDLSRVFSVLSVFSVVQDLRN
jgi:hypothetical protein